MTRREWLALLASVPLLTAADPAKPLFFTAEEFTLLDTLTDLIVPSDSHSPGAKAAGVAEFIDRVTAQAFPGEAKSSWQTGLSKLNAEAKERFGKPFVALSVPQQNAFLGEMDKRNDPFFGQLKQTTAFAYYSSSIGIHQDMEYKGNVILPEFVGNTLQA